MENRRTYGGVWTAKEVALAVELRAAFGASWSHFRPYWRCFESKDEANIVLLLVYAFNLYRYIINTEITAIIDDFFCNIFKGGLQGARRTHQIWSPRNPRKAKRSFGE
jgi:hypothetical protein